MKSLPSRIDGVSLTKVGKESILYNVLTGKVHILNETGAAIWEMLDGRLRLDEIAMFLEKEYGADPEEAREDINEFIEELQEMELLT